MTDSAALVQGSPEWHLARSTRFTASEFAPLTVKLKSGEYGAGRDHVIVAVALARWQGRAPEPGYENEAMRRGKRLEPFARAAYEIRTGEFVELEGFAVHPKYDFIGCSTDGLCGSDGMVEFKCPDSQPKHTSYLLQDLHVKEYWYQLQGQLCVKGRAWVDAVSYDPRFPEELQLAIKRVYRDEETIKRIERACKDADVEADALVEQLSKLRQRNRHAN